MQIRGRYNVDEALQLLRDQMSPEQLVQTRVHIMRDQNRPPNALPTPTPTQQAAANAQAAHALANQRKADGKVADAAAEEARLLDEINANPPDAEEVTKPRSRKKRRRKPASDTPKTALEWLQQAAQVLTQRRIDNGEQIDAQQAYNASLYELKQGIFNPLHWTECGQLTEDHLQNVPVSGPDPKLRSYAYPDPDNIRTLATYSNGTPTTAPPRYSGNSLDGSYRDMLLVWKRLTFAYENHFQPGAIEPTFIQIDGTATAYANRRGSAPMLSFIAKTWSVKDGSSRLTTTEPPTEKAWSFYYRYKVPDTPAPFYNTRETKRAIRTMRQVKHEETDGTLEKAVVLIAPRPMYGRGFNNNVVVTTQFNPAVKIWQIKLPPPGTSRERYCYMVSTGAKFVIYSDSAYPIKYAHVWTKSLWTAGARTYWANSIAAFTIDGNKVLNPANDDGSHDSSAQIEARLPPSLVSYYPTTRGTMIPLLTITHNEDEMYLADGSYESSLDDWNIYALKRAVDATGIAYPDSNYQANDLGLGAGTEDTGATLLWDPYNKRWEQLPEFITHINQSPYYARINYLRQAGFTVLLEDAGGGRMYYTDLTDPNL